MEASLQVVPMCSTPGTIHAARLMVTILPQVQSIFQGPGKCDDRSPRSGCWWQRCAMLKLPRLLLLRHAATWCRQIEGVIAACRALSAYQRWRVGEPCGFSGVWRVGPVVPGVKGSTATWERKHTNMWKSCIVMGQAGSFHGDGLVALGEVIRKRWKSWQGDFLEVACRLDF